MVRWIFVWGIALQLTASAIGANELNDRNNKAEYYHVKAGHGISLEIYVPKTCFDHVISQPDTPIKTPDGDILNVSIPRVILGLEKQKGDDFVVVRLTFYFVEGNDNKPGNNKKKFVVKKVDYERPYLLPHRKLLSQKRALLKLIEEHTVNQHKKYKALEKALASMRHCDLDDSEVFAKDNQ